MEPQNPNFGSSDGQSSSWQTGTKHDTSDSAQEAKDAARDRATLEAEHGKQTASRAVSDGAAALNKAAESLNEQGQQTLAQTTSSIASGLSDFAHRLEGRNTEELLQEITGLARRNPGLFVLGSIGAGLLLSRFFKASASTSRGPR
ncbi:hypothetical protein [Marinobacter fonticola]|uniref:hypothetical protein n=1 Tax=Marinobacter fonticola TaxID=2603215 RepID=UPI0011E665CF|nr:hypothetical protein [Marinobacter fonticola]